MTYRREAPPFHIWNEGDVHELVCDTTDDLKNRMRFGTRRCTDPQCDWCNDNKRLTLIRQRKQTKKITAPSERGTVTDAAYDRIHLIGRRPQPVNHVLHYYAHKLETSDAADWPHLRLRTCIHHYLKLNAPN